MKAQFTAVVVSVVFLSAGATAWALTAQGPGVHSTISTTTGPVRDDKLAQMIKDAITTSGKTPSSVKVFFGSCYGGGMLDDLVNVLASTGIPLIGASAADSNQYSWGPDDAWAQRTGDGDFWTDALADAVTGASPGQSVADTVATANANDPTAPGGAYAGTLPPGSNPEDPQTVTANGGENVHWSTAAEVVVFGGNNTSPRHGNDVTNMENAFLGMFGSDPNSNFWSTAGNPNGSGSKEELQNMITTACNNINTGDELVLYLDDHGNTEFDFDEWWRAMYPLGFIQLDPLNGFVAVGPGGEWPWLHEGWEQGLSGNENQGDEVAPGINLLADITEPWPIDSFFDVYWDGTPLELPDELLPGEEAFIPIPYDAVLFAEGPHVLEFIGNPDDPAPFPVELLNLELTSGPIDHLTFAPPLDGDYNGDGIIDAADYTVWRDTMAAGSNELLNDRTPGIVDEEDYFYWKEHFGEEVPPPGAGSGLAAIPEPASWCLAVLALLALAAWRRR